MFAVYRGPVLLLLVFVCVFASAKPQFGGIEKGLNQLGQDVSQLFNHGMVSVVESALDVTGLRDLFIAIKNDVLQLYHDIVHEFMRALWYVKLFVCIALTIVALTVHCFLSKCIRSALEMSSDVSGLVQKMKFLAAAVVTGPTAFVMMQPAAPGCPKQTLKQAVTVNWVMEVLAMVVMFVYYKYDGQFWIPTGLFFLILFGSIFTTLTLCAINPWFVAPMLAWFLIEGIGMVVVSIVDFTIVMKDSAVPLEQFMYALLAGAMSIKAFYGTFCSLRLLQFLRSQSYKDRADIELNTNIGLQSRKKMKKLKEENKGMKDAMKKMKEKKKEVMSAEDSSDSD